MAEVLLSSIKHDGEVFEVGSPASKLPKAVRVRARFHGGLGPAPKKAEKPEVQDEDEPGTEE